VKTFAAIILLFVSAYTFAEPLTDGSRIESDNFKAVLLFDIRQDNRGLAQNMILQQKIIERLKSSLAEYKLDEKLPPEKPEWNAELSTEEAKTLLGRNGYTHILLTQTGPTTVKEKISSMNGQPYSYSDHSMIVFCTVNELMSNKQIATNNIDAYPNKAGISKFFSDEPETNRKGEPIYENAYPKAVATCNIQNIEALLGKPEKNTDSEDDSLF